MKILTVDIGTGTQDIFLYDSRLDIENGYKLVVPSPTMIVHRRLKEAARSRRDVLLHGLMMGGGPSAWAAEDHVRQGLRVFATPDAARSFNDDLDAVRATGIEIVSEDEAARLPAAILRLELRDLDLDAIATALAQFGVDLETLDAVAAAVFDHGDSPPGYSDRQFRFDYLDRRIRAENRLSAFAYRAEDIPSAMTRLQSVAQAARRAGGRLGELPLVVMDTAPAAVLGAGFDPQVQARRRVLVANVGNFHTLAFRLGPAGIEGVFEHHTGLLDRPALETLIRSLAGGSLTHADVFEHHGHGALIYDAATLPLDGPDFGMVVTGPRRSLLAGSDLRPHFAAPFGDMMIAGCFGLLAAAADLLPEFSDAIHRSLSASDSRGVAPWDA